MTRLPFDRIAGPGPWACIDSSAIACNLAWLQHRLRPDAPEGVAPRLWAVVKADAYGHGLAHALAALGPADGLCVTALDEVSRIRARGWTGPILLLSTVGIEIDELRDPSLGKLHIVIDDPAVLLALEHLSPGLPRIHAWLRYAGRLRSQGFNDTDYIAAFRRLYALARAGALAGAGHLHHYAAAEDPQSLALERRAFATVTAGLPGPHCTGNSAALCSEIPITLHAEGHWLRCGLALYGASALPEKTGAQLGLRPAMSLHARLLAIRSIAAGQTVGYGDSFRAARDTCVGVVGIGYGHGLPRRLWQQGRLLTSCGRTAPLAGRIAMDCLTVDLGPRPTERPGDIMTLWGIAPDGTALPVEKVALSVDTIAAELLTGLTARVPLIPKEGAGRH